MSYILDALKKSDNERQQGTIPDLQSRHSVYPEFSKRRKKKPKTLWVVLLTTVFVVSSGAIFWYVVPYLPFSLQITSKDSATAAEKIPAVQKNTAQKIVQSTPKTQVTEQLVPKPQVTEQPEPKPQVTEQPTPKTQIIEQPTPKTQITEQPIARQATGNSPSIADEPKEQPIQQPDVTLQPAPITPAKETSSENTDEKIIPRDSLPYLSELPADVRTDIPNLRFAAHTYSEQPEKRMIIVNNQIKRQGQWIDKGLLLEEITWEGVVLSFNGLRFQVITTQ
ncbi:general secretion pathway protein GspB [Desulfosediminicola ganghwensis]|uniref:general secretion pathway protein GspB n=1 Tax=Desulfosediminicola ganghwensis TaxID=2569540 RepID=UPI0010ACC7E2|nr:general secretion pathway protein GspB [Desulfosediminicola ganghwensis]